jgi:hypothetical protein
LSPAARGYDRSDFPGCETCSSTSAVMTTPSTALRSPACRSIRTSLVGLLWPLDLDLDLRGAFLDEANSSGGSP